MNKLFTQYYGSVFFLIILLFITGSLLVLKPKLNEVKVANAQISATLLNLEGERKYLDSLDQSIHAAQTISPEVLEQVDLALPRLPKIPEILVLLENIAERLNIQMTNVNFTDAPTVAKNESAIAEMNINLTVAAENYQQIKKFIRDLEASMRLLDINGINVSLQKDKSTYSIQMKTYIYSPKTKTAVPPASKPQ